MFQKLFFLYFLQNTLSISLFKLTSCGTPTDLLQNVELSVQPELPQKDYTLYLSGLLNQDIIKGSSRYDITYNFIPLSPTTNDLCTEIGNSNASCPLASGFFASVSKGTIDQSLSGSVKIKNQWINEDGQKILCMKFDIKL